jgi:hypothetical protein
MTTYRPPRPPAVRPSPAELALPIAAVAVAVLLPLAYAEVLPDPVATHWGWRGVPDGALPRAVDHALLAVMTALVALGPLWGAARADRGSARVLVGLANGGAAMFMVLRWWSLESNAGAVEWPAAAPIGWRELGLTLAATLLGGVAGAWLARGRPDHPPSTVTVAPAELAPDDTVVWVGRQTAGPALVVPAAAVVAATALVAVVPGVDRVATLAVGGVLVLVAAALLTFTRAAVAVSERGLDVRLGFGRPHVVVPLGDVTSVGVQHVEPMAFGGWGYRVVPGARAVVVRRGEGLRVGRRGRPDLIVTVDGAADAAAVLQGLIARRS